MKKILIMIAALGFISACTSEEEPTAVETTEPVLEETTPMGDETMGEEPMGEEGMGETVPEEAEEETEDVVE